MRAPRIHICTVRLRGRHALSTRPPIDRYGFTLLRSDTHHLYAFTRTQFVDTLQRWCKGGAARCEVRIHWKPSCSLQMARPATSPTTPSPPHPAESAGTRHSIPTSTCLQGHSSPSTEQQLVRSAYAVEGQRRCGSLAQEISRRGTTSCRVHTPTRPASASTARGSQGISPRRSRCPPKGEAPCRQ